MGVAADAADVGVSVVASRGDRPGVAGVGVGEVGEDLVCLDPPGPDLVGQGASKIVGE